ncbi:MAG: hypothetical protein FJ187_09950, partial [Gammaproteobacteria bacterium]|nr:hypothetical protein [Gammaproteobacteria bacterium]
MPLAIGYTAFLPLKKRAARLFSRRLQGAAGLIALGLAGDGFAVGRHHFLAVGGDTTRPILALRERGTSGKA